MQLPFLEITRLLSHFCSFTYNYLSSLSSIRGMIRLKSEEAVPQLFALCVLRFLLLSRNYPFSEQPVVSNDHTNCCSDIRFTIIFGS